MTKYIALLSAVCVLGFAAQANAQETTTVSSSTTTTTTTTSFPGEFAANVALTSDYVFRGISQSDEGPAIQGGFDYTYDAEGDGFPGFYAGVWGSSVDFNDGDEASAEFDLYAGLSGTFDQYATGWKLGGIYYAYPGADDSLDYDFWEVAASLTHDFGPFATTLSYNYSPEYFGETGDAHYTALAATVPLPYDLTLNGNVGYQTIEDGEDYLTWSAGLGYTWNGFGLSLAYIDTDLDEPEECADGCSERVVFTVSKAF